MLMLKMKERKVKRKQYVDADNRKQKRNNGHLFC